MAMGKRRQQPKQATMWVATNDLPEIAAHPFYPRLNLILPTRDFDQYVEGLCQRFYADDGRPCLPGQGQDDRHRRNDAGGECCAARHRAGLCERPCEVHHSRRTIREPAAIFQALRARRSPRLLCATAAFYRCPDVKTPRARPSSFGVRQAKHAILVDDPLGSPRRAWRRL